MTTFRVATWNIWFDELCRRERHEALMHRLWMAKADVIALQEVTHDALAELLENDWLTSRYSLSDTTGETIGGYGVLLATRLPVVGRFHWMELPTQFGRQMVSVPVEVGGVRLRVGTVHLESMRPNADLRVAQLDEIMPFLAEEAPAILMGDFNFDPSMDEEGRIVAPWTDVWAAARPDDPGFTRDSTHNRMIEQYQDKVTHRRIDRIVLADPEKKVTVRGIELLGTEPVGDDETILPSDHFGLVAEFSC